MVINTTSPNVVVESDATSGQTRKFSVSIQSISEVDANNQPLPRRTIDVSEVEFILSSENSTGLNKVHNYSAVLENGALLNVIVSLLIFRIIKKNHEKFFDTRKVI